MIMYQQTNDAPGHLETLLQVFEHGPVFYQLTPDTLESAEADLATVDQATGSDRDRVVVKLPAQPWLYGLAARLTREGRQVAFTAVYDAGQAVCAVEAGARWMMPYVDRASRLESDKGAIVPRLAPFVPAKVVLLAASIKSTDQALAALSEGADAVTTTWPVIEGLMSHVLTDSAVDEFMALDSNK
jgi:transaldolase